MNRNRHLLFLSAALIAPAVLCAHAARAQDVAAPDQSPASAPETAALPGPQNAEAAQDEGLSDIVVTATRREERLQDVPVSVTAIDSASLDRANISSTANLIQAIPALTITRNTSTANPAIRGIVSNGVSVGDEPNVGFYVDGVYQPVSTANIFDLAGVERVEVLRGPQGTLFGRNSMGGLINVITRDPTQDTEGELRVSAGRFSEFSGRGYISGGLAENVAGSLSLSGSRNSGF